MIDREPNVQVEQDTSTRNPPQLWAWLASAVTISLIAATQFLPGGDHPLLRRAGVLVLLLAGAFIFWPFYLLARHGGQTGQGYMQAALVVDRGLYAVVRHPQYLGYILLGWGFALLSQHGVTVLLALAATGLFYGQSVMEERACLAQFDKAYAQYRRRVPRFNVVWGLFRLFRGGKRS